VALWVPLEQGELLIASQESGLTMVDYLV
jgi:hypothetical protein